MRNLPTKRSEKQTLIIKAVEDFCGADRSTKRNIVNVALWIMKRRRRITLDEHEKLILWHVEQNLTDYEYCKNLLPLDPTIPVFAT